jgi:hypothetical protein
MKFDNLVNDLIEIKDIISSVSMNTLINHLAGIGTFISSIIALIALRELIKQRRAMYQPSLFLNEFTLSVKGNPLAESKNFFYFKTHNLHEAENKKDKTKHSISSQVFMENLGYGIANQVNYKWDFDYKRALKILCKLDDEFSFEIRNNEKSILLTRNNKFYGTYDFERISKESKIDFIKPENLQLNKKPLSIPMLITSIHMDYVLIKNKMTTEICNKFNYEKYENFPKPKLLITYKDIAGKKYNNKYEFNLSCGNSFLQTSDFEIDTTKDYAFLTFRAN